jgi:hypothetical protein
MEIKNKKLIFMYCQNKWESKDTEASNILLFNYICQEREHFLKLV